MKPRVVFDCMVYLQGAARPTGPAGACFRLVDDDQITLCTSAEIVVEVRDVLTRPKTLRQFPGLSPAWVEAFLQNVASKALVVTQAPKVYALKRDPKDEPYLNLAIATAARFLVSRDRDLLDLMNDSEFRSSYPSLAILDPVAFLQARSSWEPTEAGDAAPPQPENGPPMPTPE